MLLAGITRYVVASRSVPEHALAAATTGTGPQGPVGSIYSRMKTGQPTGPSSPVPAVKIRKPPYPTKHGRFALSLYNITIYAQTVHSQKRTTPPKKRPANPPS